MVVFIRSSNNCPRLMYLCMLGSDLGFGLTLDVRVNVRVNVRVGLGLGLVCQGVRVKG